MFILAVFVASASTRLAPKMRNGSPTTFAEHRLPAVAGESERENSRLFEAVATATGSRLEWSQLIDCDSSDFFGISFISTRLKLLTFELIDPNGNIVDFDKLRQAGRFPLNDDGTHFIDTFNVELTTPVRGKYKLSVWTSHLEEFQSTVPIQNLLLGAAIVYNDSPIEIFSHLTSYELDVGKSVGLVAHVANDVAEPTAAAAVSLADAVDDARMAIMAPDGTERWIPMHDDGLHADGAAGDGVFGAQFIPSQSGDYIWRAQLSGRSATGVAFQRSTQHLVRVAEVDAQLVGTGVVSVDSSGRVAVALDVKLPASPPAGLKFHTYAELWTTGGQSVGWAMAVADVVNSQVVLTWDMRWLARAGVDAATSDFELRHAYISELEGFVPVSTAAVITLSLDNTQRTAVRDGVAAVAATAHVDDEALVFGPRPQWIEDAAQAAIAAGDPTDVILIHGYCATVNPFVGKGHNWKLAHVFQDFNQNLPNDEFARRLDAYADSKGLAAWSGIGHSQAGVVMVHLRSTYWSALDVAAIKHKALAVPGAAAKRLIQSVGTPWKGCSGAGSAANLIKLFGYACGANADLTPDGAALWLASVVPEAAKEAYYYPTVNFKNPGFFDSSCNWATNLVLDSPNDGTTELSRADLPNGNNAGITERQCHTEDMNYPAQTSDAKRNALMDSLAI